MKKIISLALTFLIFSLQVQAQNFSSPDILINTQLDADWSGVLVMKIRKAMKNFGLSDPFSQKFDKPLVVSEAKVQDYLNPSAKRLLNDLGHMLKMDFLNGKTQVTIHGLNYAVRGFKTELRATEDNVEGLSVSSGFSASKVRVSADKVTLSLIIPGKESLPVINIEIIKPVISASEDKLINFFAKIQIKDKKDAFKLLLEDADFSNMAACMVEGMDGISLDFDRIIVPTVRVLVGGREIAFDPGKIEDLIRSHRDGIKGLLVAQVSSLLNKGTGEDLLKAINNVEFAKKYWIDSSTIQSMLRIDSFTSPHGNLVEVKMSGDFCPPSFYKDQGEKCIQNKVTLPAKSRITEEDHSESRDSMRKMIDQGNANIVVSISEDYVNKVLVSTYDGGLWNDMLKEAGLAMGPNKVFIRMDEKNSPTGTLYMDLLYTPKKLERMAIGAKQVRFPLVVKVGLKIKLVNRIPTFVIHMAEVDTSDETLLNGKPEIGVVSNIHTLRLKKKVLASLRKETASLANKDVLELNYPELRGLGLEKVDFVSDGKGRMNAIILLEDNNEFPISGRMIQK